MNKKYLFLMLGVPGSGKSYFAERLAKELGAVNLNSDAMRMAIFKSREETDRIYHSEGRSILNTYTFGAINYATSSALKSGFSVVYDANNNTRQERHDTSMATCNNIVQPIVVWVKTPQDVAVRRAQERRETSSDRKLSNDEASKYIQKIADEIEAPSQGEVSIIIDGTAPFEEQYESFNKQLAELESE